MIVVTGLGAVTALGATLAESWERIVRGERGLSEVSLFPAEDYRVRLVGEIEGIRRDGPSDFSRTSELASRAAVEALESAGIEPFVARPGGSSASVTTAKGSTRAGNGAVGTTRPRPSRIGLVVGGSTAGMLETELLLGEIVTPSGEIDARVGDAAVRRMLSHPLSAPTDRLARELGPFSRVRSLSSACSSGANALLVGATWLRLGLVDAVLCGAADALCRVTLGGFGALGALDPEGARPFDRSRRGLTLGEGAGFVVLERAEDAAARGQRVFCTFLGWAARAEAHHITNPEPSGAAPSQAMVAALARAGLSPGDIDYVNAHGTGTALNDSMESRALARVFGAGLERIPVSSQKGQIGHTLAAAGAIEAAFTALAIAKGVVPPTGGLETPDPECALRHVREAEHRSIQAALSSSFGFGGMDTVLVFGHADRSRASAARMQARSVVVTGAAVVTPRGVFENAEVATIPSLRCDGDAVTFDLDAELTVARARRLDRQSRLAAIACERALRGRTEEARDAGVILGNAFGAVDGTATFMRRLREKGARFASPADFPSLVPSSPAGHVSIYLGLTGPTLVVADLAVSGECAVTQAFELIAAGEAEELLAVAVEEKSAIVDHVFRVVFGPDTKDGRRAERPLRREGAGALALASEAAAIARGAPVLARIAHVLTWTHADDADLADLPPPPAGSIVVLGAASAVVDELLERSGWAGVRRVRCADEVGSHEAIGGIALAVAAATLASDPSLSHALCTGAARGSGYAIVLERPSERRP